MISIENYKGVALQDEWIPKVIAQLNKDLLLTGFEQQFDTNLSLDEFIEVATSYFESILLNRSAQLFNLLYRIDVSQEKIVSIQNNVQETLAYEIIRREFQKVVLKSQF